MKGLTRRDLKKEFDNIYQVSDKIPNESLKLSDIGKENDGYNFIQRNIVDLLINSFKNIQPLSYLYLKKGEFFYAVKRSNILVMDDITRFGFIINDFVYFISYNPYCLSYFNIPFELLNSWFLYSKRWGSAEEIVFNIYKSNLPSLHLMPLHSIISDFDDQKGYAKPQYRDFLETKFNHAFRSSYEDEQFYDDEKYFELRCLLDTRPNDDWSETGYQLFVSSHNKERNVYVVPKANVLGIKKLINPAEAIDRYAAHLFSRAEGEFDFMQFAEDF
ncbi:hypothetical protein F9B74_09785 [Pelistega sp. NLN82]|uniref:Uncharacterized protein n=1 Tax=Pelistega ratti TaxID=2652177 RepID=A0A6L9YA42_9BURK|nr:hypothetical protein [Pelistega ratti]NEN76594.1 hypothetical protein [Pelistega ratti]